MWYAVYEVASGRLISTGTVLAPADELAAKSLAVTQLGLEFVQAGKDWDAAQLKFVQRLPAEGE